MWLLTIHLILWLVTVINGPAIHASPQSSGQVSPKAHRHVMLLESELESIDPEFSMVEISLPTTSKKEDLVTNRTRTYDAFTVSGTRLFVMERKTGKTFEIRGLPLDWRPFSDLVWQNRHMLAFDRWSQPHFGVHYAVNVTSKRLVTAKPFPDEFYLEQQRPKHQGTKKH
jgi:hypothetical protein